MATSSTSGVGGSSGSSDSILGAASAQELSTQFLTMLTAQMKNQDPLNPLDNAELTSQLAQISTVSGISQLNTTMQWLGYSMGSLQATQSMSLIGHQVLMAGDSLALADGSAKGGYYLGSAVDAAQLVVRNASGVEVARVALSDVDAGVHSFNWDGKDGKGNTLADGNYTFEVDVTQGASTATAQALAVSQVASVQPSSGSTSVIDDKGNLVNLSDIYQVW